MKREYIAGMAAIVAAASVAAGIAMAQSKYANDTFTVVSRSDGGRVNMNIRGTGDHCWATTSDDNGVGIAMGDDLCKLRDEGFDDDAAMQARISPSKISFRLDEKSYVVTDAGTIKQARSLFDPLVSIEEQQSELGKKQSDLGKKQGELGRQQRDVKVKVPDMSGDFKKVEADAKRLSAQGGTESDLGDLQSELGDLQSKLGDLQSEAGDAQSKLGDQQSELGDQQGALGEQQGDLGEKSGAIAADLADKLKKMLKQTIQNGTAKPA